MSYGFTRTSRRWTRCSRRAAGASWSRPGRMLPCWRRAASLPRWAPAAGNAPPRGPAGPARDPTGCWGTPAPPHTAYAWGRKQPRKVRLYEGKAKRPGFFKTSLQFGLSLNLWRSSDLVHGRRCNGVPEQLAAERAINTFIHVVQELCVFIVVTCVNIEAAVLFTGKERRAGLCFVVDYSTARAWEKTSRREHRPSSVPCGDLSATPTFRVTQTTKQCAENTGRSPGARLSQPRFTSSFPITLTARLKAEAT